MESSTIRNSANFQVDVVPEPGVWGLMLSGLAGSRSGAGERAPNAYGRLIVSVFDVPALLSQSFLRAFAAYMAFRPDL